MINWQRTGSMILKMCPIVGLVSITGCYVQNAAFGSAEPDAQTGTQAESTHDASSESRAQTTPDASIAHACGDGVIAPDEECDPAASSWHSHCDASCKRTSYKRCTDSQDCAGMNDNCAAYSDSSELFCADYCESDAACPVLPGYRAACNFAWCAVLCDDGACPNGMTCKPDVQFIDHAGHPTGSRDVCVISSRGTSRKGAT